MDAVDSLPQGVVTFFVAYEYLALVALFFISEAGVPLPLPNFALILYASHLSGQGQGNLFLILLSVVVGMLAGSLVLYLAASRGGRPLLQKYGKYMRINPERLARAESWFHRRGRLAIVLGYLIPGIRYQTVVAAGVFQVRRRTFLSSAAISAIVWTSFYICLGLVFGNAYALVTGSLKSPYLVAAVVAVVLAVIVWIAVRRTASVREKAEAAAERAVAWIPTKLQELAVAAIFRGRVTGRGDRPVEQLALRRIAPAWSQQL
ncbi:MAG: DedA family protein [Dehalococcoidia bacterium]